MKIKIYRIGKVHLLLVFTWSSLLYSCSGYKTISGVTVADDKNGKWEVTTPKYNISITYYGDYWFHELNKKQMLNWNEELIDLINENRKRKILYSTHTTIDPYCSSIGILYKYTAVNTFVQSEITLLSEKYKARNLRKENNKLIGSKNYTKLIYELHDDRLRINIKCNEYYTICDEYILRIIFWSMENDEWLKKETEEIIKTIRCGIYLR